MACLAHVNPRVCRALDIDELVYRGNVVPGLGTSSIDRGSFPRWVFIFMGFTVNSTP